MPYKLKFTKEQIQNAISETSENGNLSMRKAAAFLGVKFDTFRKYAIIYELWSPNKSGKGLTKRSGTKIELDKILVGDHPSYSTYMLKQRLFSELNWQRICSSCNLTEWLGGQIPLELDHVDGNKYNHKLENLRLLCPNCHALTPTYRAKNMGSYFNKYSE